MITHVCIVSGDALPNGAADPAPAAGPEDDAVQRRQTAELWLAVLRVLARTSRQPNQHLRHHAIQALHGCGSSDVWLQPSQVGGLASMGMRSTASQGSARLTTNTLPYQGN